MSQNCYGCLFFRTIEPHPLSKRYSRYVRTCVHVEHPLHPIHTNVLQPYVRTSLRRHPYFNIVRFYFCFLLLCLLPAFSRNIASILRKPECVRSSLRFEGRYKLTRVDHDPSGPLKEAAARSLERYGNWAVNTHNHIKSLVLRLSIR